MLKLKNAFLNFCIEVINALFVIIAFFLFLLSIFNTSIISVDYTEYTYFIKDNIIRNICIILFVVVILFLLKRYKIFEKIENYLESNKKTFAIIKYCLLFVIFVFALIWILEAHLYPEADQYDVQNAVKGILNNNFSSLDSKGYLDRYPFQSGIVLLSCLFALIFKPQNYMAMELVNVLSMAIIYKELSDISSYLKVNKLGQLLIILSGIIYPVPLFYSYFIYGTFIGLASILISIKYLLIYLNNKSKIAITVSSLTTLLAMIAKSNFIIFSIAIVIILVLEEIKSHSFTNIIYSATIVISIIVSSNLPPFIIENVTGKTLDNGISYTADIAMGLQESERAPGWYNGYNNDSYEEANYNTQKQKLIATKEIENRLQTFKKDGDYVYEFFIKKIASSWNNPTFQVFWNLEGKIASDSTYNSWAMFFIQKQGIHQFQKYLNIIQSLILFGVFLFVVFNKNKSLSNAIIPLIIIGGFLFHLAWEAKAQYMITYFILLIPLSFIGYSNMLENRIEINKRFIALIVVFVIILSTFLTNKNSFLNTDNLTYYNYIYDIKEY